MSKFFLGTTFLVSLFYCSNNLVAQDKYVVNATVIDNNRQPVFMASVVLRDSKNKLLSVVNTNENGKATISVPYATNPSILVVSMVGFSSYRKEIIFDAGKTLNLGKIVINQNAVLDSIVVTAPRLIRRTRDAFIYDVEKDPKAKVTKIVNLLAKLPFIEIEFDNDVSIFGGSKKIAYLLNGKPSPLLSSTKLTMKSITGINIKSIELLPNPPDNYVNYDAVINIVTRKSLFEGILFGIEEGASVSVQNGRVNSRIDIASNIKKFSFVLRSSFTLNRMFSDNHSYNSRMSDTTATNYNGIFSKIETDSYSNSNSSSQNFIFQGTYVVSKKSSFNFLAQYLNSYSNNDIFSANKFSLIPTSNYNATRNTISIYNILNGKVSFSTQKLREKGFNIDYDISIDNRNSKQLYNIYKSSDTSNTKTKTLDNNQSHKITFNKIIKVNENNSITLQSYYSLSKKLTSGDLFNYNDLENIWEIDLNKNNYIKNLQNNAALDLSYNLIMGINSFTFKLGSIFCSDTYYLKENNQERIHKNYWLFTPSITYSIIPGIGKNLKVLYTRVSQLPSSSQINPYYDQVDPLYINTGNPNLKQEISDMITISYGFQKPKTMIVTNINYAHTWNSIESVKYVNDQGANVSTYDNIGAKDIVSIRLYYKRTIIWGLDAFSSIQYTKTMAKLANSFKSINSYNANVNLMYRIDRTLMLGLSGILSPSRVDATIQNNKNFYNINTKFEISGNSKNMKLNWGVSIDAFEKSYKRITTQDSFNGYILTSKKVDPGRTLGFRLSYSFGKIQKSDPLQ